MKSMKMLLLGMVLSMGCFTGCQQDPCFEYSFPYCENCIDLYQPVCGCNGRTYRNTCEAECKGIKNYVFGECPDISTR